MPRESSLTDQIVKALRREGCYVEKVHGSPFGLRGSADLVVCVPMLNEAGKILPGQGRYLRLEVKRPGQALSAIQKARIYAAGDAGGRSGVVRSVADAVNAVHIVRNTQRTESQ